MNVIKIFQSITAAITGFFVAKLFFYAMSNVLDFWQRAEVGVGLVTSVQYNYISLGFESIISVIWFFSCWLNSGYEGWFKKSIILFVKSIFVFVILFFGLCFVIIEVLMSLPGGAKDIPVLGIVPAGWVSPVGLSSSFVLASMLTYVFWRRGIQVKSNSIVLPVKGLFYSILFASHKSYISDVIKESDYENNKRNAYERIKIFENEIAKLQISGIQIRSVLYMDDFVPVLVRPESGIDSFSVDNGEMRSHAFRIRRGFDEFWIVLRAKISEGSLSWRLEAKSRNRNIFGPFILFAAMLTVLLLWLAQSSMINYALIGFGIIGGLQHVGMWEFIFSKERGENRREERLEGYMPAFVKAAFAAIYSKDIVFTESQEPIDKNSRADAGKPMQNSNKNQSDSEITNTWSGRE